MMKITGLSHLFKWENLHNWWLIKYFFAPLYVCVYICVCIYMCVYMYVCMCIYIYIYICMYVYIQWVRKVFRPP